MVHSERFVPIFGDSASGPGLKFCCFNAESLRAHLDRLGAWNLRVAVAAGVYRLAPNRVTNHFPESRPIPSCRQLRLLAAGSDAGEVAVNPGKILGVARSGVRDDRMAGSNRPPAAVHPVQSDGRGGNQEESTQRLVVVHPGQWDARDSLGKAKFPEEVLRARSDEPEKPVDSK
jgi:hypothetical protein